MTCIASDSGNLPATSRALTHAARLSRPFDLQQASPPATAITALRTSLEVLLNNQGSALENTASTMLVEKSAPAKEKRKDKKRSKSSSEENDAVHANTARVKKPRILPGNTLEDKVQNWVQMVNPPAELHMQQAYLVSMDKQRLQQERLQDLLEKQLRQQQEQQQLLMVQQMQLKLLQQELLKKQDKKLRKQQKLKKKQEKLLKEKGSVDLSTYMKAPAMQKWLNKQKDTQQPSQNLQVHQQNHSTHTTWQQPQVQQQQQQQAQEQQSAEWMQYLDHPGPAAEQLNNQGEAGHGEVSAGSATQGHDAREGNNDAWFTGHDNAPLSKDWEEDVNWELLAEGGGEVVDSNDAVESPAGASSTVAGHYEQQQQQHGQSSMMCPVRCDLEMCQEGTTKYAGDSMVYMPSPAPSCMVANCADYESHASAATMMSPYNKFGSPQNKAAVPCSLDLFSDSADFTRGSEQHDSLAMAMTPAFPPR